MKDTTKRDSKKLRNFALVASVTLLTSCAHNYGPESFQEKMNRYNTQAVSENKVPTFDVPEIMYTNTKIDRKIASNDSDYWSKLSNKSLYFITLLDEYKKLGQYTQAALKEINTCPNFHSIMIENTQYGQANHVEKHQLNFEKIKKLSIVDKSKFPFMSLPVNAAEMTPTVWDIYQKDNNLQAIVEGALSTHLDKTYKELQELCSTGTSTNYYNFENLVGQFITKENWTASTSSMKVLLKTTVYNNMAIIKSFEVFKQNGQVGRAIASKEDTSYQNTTYALYKRTNSYWAKDYFNYLEK